MTYLKIIFSFFVLILVSCSVGGGNEIKNQVKKDILDKMATGICDSIPAGSKITNIVVGEIVEIEGMGMTDVSIEFDYEKDGVKKHHTGALLYVTQGKYFALGALGGCDWEPSFMKGK